MKAEELYDKILKLIESRSKNNRLPVPDKEGCLILFNSYEEHVLSSIYFSFHTMDVFAFDFHLVNLIIRIESITKDKK